MVLNWRRDSDYAYTSKLTYSQWAWEFLRRNSDYRAAWSLHQKAASDALGFQGQQIRFGFEASFPYGLSHPVDPNVSAVEIEDIPWRVGVFLLQSTDYLEIRKDDPWPGYPVSIPLWFYADWPVDALLKAAEEILHACREELRSKELLEPWEPTPPFNRARYRLYLRLLDAEYDGASQAQMGDALFSDKAEPRDSARRTLATAKRLARRGYQGLLLRTGRKGGR